MGPSGWSRYRASSLANLSEYDWQNVRRIQNQCSVFATVIDDLQPAGADAHEAFGQVVSDSHNHVSPSSLCDRHVRRWILNVSQWRKASDEVLWVIRHCSLS